MIWEPFVFALVLGIIIAAGLYVAYLWPPIEPVEPGDAPGATSNAAVPGDASHTAPTTTTDPTAGAAP